MGLPTTSISRAPGLRLLLTLLAITALATISFVTADVEVASSGVCAPGDDRATCVEGNATTCEQAGITASNILFGNGANDNSDANVSGDVSGSDPQVLNVTVLNPEVVIRGIVVKGSNEFNVYSSIVSDMHAPIAGGSGKPAGISHWFVCYDLEAPPPTTAPPTTAPPTTTPATTAPATTAPATTAPPTTAAGAAAAGQAQAGAAAPQQAAAAAAVTAQARTTG
jgi:hypothetical protein